MLPLMLADCDTGQPKDLERAHDASQVIGADADGGFLVYAAQFLMKMAQPAALRRIDKLRTDCGRSPGSGEDSCA